MWRQPCVAPFGPLLRFPCPMQLKVQFADLAAVLAPGPHHLALAQLYVCSRPGVSSFHMRFITDTLPLHIHTIIRVS